MASSSTSKGYLSVGSNDALSTRSQWHSLKLGRRFRWRQTRRRRDTRVFGEITHSLLLNHVNTSHTHTFGESGGFEFGIEFFVAQCKNHRRVGSIPRSFACRVRVCSTRSILDLLFVFLPLVPAKVGNCSKFPAVNVPNLELEQLFDIEFWI